MVIIEKKLQVNLMPNVAQLTMPVMLAQGYSRKHIVALFETLEREGFGDYQQGQRGPGLAAKFVKNDTCPDEFSLVLSEGPRKPYKTRNNQAVNTIVCENPPVEGQMDEVAQAINAGELVAIEEPVEIPTIVVDSEQGLNKPTSDIAEVCSSIEDSSAVEIAMSNEIGTQEQQLLENA